MPEDKNDTQVDELGMSELDQIETPGEPSEEDETSPKDEPSPEQPESQESQPSQDDDVPPDLRSARQSYYKSREELKAERERIRQLELENLKLKAGRFQELTAEQLDDLKIEDPDAYIEYREEEKRHRLTQDEIKNIEQRHQKEESADADTQLFFDVVKFISSVTGVEIDNPEPGKLPKEITEFASSPEYKQVSDYLDKKFFSRGIMPDADDMMAAYRHVHFDKLVAMNAANQKNQIVNNINKASRGGSVFDRVPGEQGRKSATTAFDKMTPAQQEKFLENAGEKELEEYDRWLSSQGQ